MTREAGAIDPAARRSASIRAGAIAGLAGLAVFLSLHHVWIVPIWFIAPVGGVMAAGGGAAVGAAYAELVPRLPARPWTALAAIALIAVVLGPAIVIGELTGPVYAIAPDGGGTLLVAPSSAVAAFVGGLLVTTSLTGAAVGAVVGRTRRAAGSMALAGLALAIGPGHNIPMLGGSPATAKELTILAAVVTVAAVVLVESEAILERR